VVRCGKQIFAMTVFEERGVQVSGGTDVRGGEASYVYLSVRLSVSPRVYRGRRRVRRRLTSDVSTDPTDRARRATDMHYSFAPRRRAPAPGARPDPTPVAAGTGVLSAVRRRTALRSTGNSSASGSAAEWLACWTQAHWGLGSNRSGDAVG